MDNIIVIEPTYSTDDSMAHLFSRLPLWVAFATKKCELTANELYIQNFDAKNLPDQIISITSNGGQIETFSWKSYHIYDTITLNDNLIENVPENFIDLLCTTLRLDGNQIHECIINLLQCECLSLKNNECKKIFFMDSNIKQLILSENLLKSLENLPNDITELDVSDNCFESIFTLECMTLEKLCLSDNNLSDIKLMLPKLEYLDLSNNGFITFDVKLPNRLKKLLLADNFIKSIGTNCLPDSLEYLDISNNCLKNFDVRIPTCLKTLKINGNLILKPEFVFGKCTFEVDYSNMYDHSGSENNYVPVPVHLPVHLPVHVPVHVPPKPIIVYSSKTPIQLKWSCEI